MSRSEMDADLARGRLRRLRRGIYSRGACAPVEVAARHGGALACVTAARHERLWVLDPDDAVHVWLGPHGRSAPHEDCSCVVHWDEAAVADAFGIPSVPRLLRQILRCRGVEEFFVALESARRLGRIGRAGLRWLLERVSPAARDAIAFSRADADSGLESLLRWRLRRYGLPVRTQVSVASVGRVDFLIGDRLVVEVDGAAHHDGSQRHKDLVRDANAAAWGFVTLRFDYAMVVHDWETVELAILAHVTRGLHRPSSR